MTDRKLTDEALAEVIVDVFNALEALSVNGKMRIAELVGAQAGSPSTATTSPSAPKAVPLTSPSYRIENVNFQLTTGPSGEYYKSVDEARENPDLHGLLEDLKAHGGKMVKDGYFYWSFKNGDAAGKKESKPTK